MDAVQRRIRAQWTIVACAGLAALALGSEVAAQEAAAEGQSQEAAGEAATQEAVAVSEVPEAKSLDELLKLVRQGWTEERKENRAREKRFREDKQNQQQLLKEAKATLAREETRSQQLELTFQENEGVLAELEETLAERLGTLGELFGVVRQVAGDTRGHIESSLVSAQIGGRAGFLAELGKSKSLPSIESLEQLWFDLQREMTEQGKVVRFRAPVLTTEGGEEEREVVRAGVFTAVSGDRYVLWEPDIQKLRELVRQPPARYVGTVAGFEASTDGIAPLAVDPSRGSLLSLLIEEADLAERIQQGKAVGYVIISLGILAGLVGLWRLAVVSLAGRKVSSQQKSDTVDDGNPLGRVLGVFESNRQADPETLELRLDEAVMRESARLERFLWFVKVVSVVAPLLGLLGTVTGMIQTFQAITLFGAGDPKMMAGGISEALVTTWLGLWTAIPLVLLHAGVANSTKRIVDVLDEQSAGLIASRAEALSA